jgi:hypothetical protein
MGPSASYLLLTASAAFSGTTGSPVPMPTAPCSRVEPGPSSHLTLCWRKPDSNSRSHLRVRVSLRRTGRKKREFPNDVVGCDRVDLAASLHGLVRCASNCRAACAARRRNRVVGLARRGVSPQQPRQWAFAVPSETTYRTLGVMPACGLWLMGSPDRAPGRELMHWQGRLAALFVVLVLAGCASVVAGPGQAPSAPYQQGDPRDTSGMH